MSAIRGGGLYSGPAYLDADWVVANFDHWGGMKNRWAPTRRLYVWKLLFAAPQTASAWSARNRLPAALDAFYAIRLLGILESIASREEWDTMIHVIKLDTDEMNQEWTQAFEELQVLPPRGLLQALQASFQSLRGAPALAARIGALERRWGTPLT